MQILRWMLVASAQNDSVSWWMRERDAAELQKGAKLCATKSKTKAGSSSRAALQPKALLGMTVWVVGERAG
ncbi:MAG TPA: hypothetical protein VKB26_09110 [Candidatus Acidoferrales bacterium]|nr:hypothetical protein [Candidatus Acidoferrales bacterium]